MNAMRDVRVCLFLGVSCLAAASGSRARAEGKPESKPASKPESKPASKPEFKTDSKVDSKADVKTEAVTFASGAEQAQGFLALPSGASKHPAIIVIHEWWGLNDWVKEKARSFAEKGEVALAVDLYRGKVATDADTAHQLMRGLPEDRSLRDLEGAFAYLAARPDVDPARIGVVGWCMGGGQALALAIAEPKLAAAVIYYGRLVTDPATIQKIKAPLLGNFGADDQGIPPESVKEFSVAAKKAGVACDFKVFSGAGHGFASNPDPKIYRPEGAREADHRTASFFATHLKSRH